MPDNNYNKKLHACQDETRRNKFCVEAIRKSFLVRIDYGFTAMFIYNTTITFEKMLQSFQRVAK